MEDVTNWLQILETLLPWIVTGLLVMGLVSFILVLTLNLLDIRRLSKQSVIFLELTPPANTDKTPEATRQLFTVFHGLYASRSFVDKLLRRRVVFSLEIVSSKERGIRYLMRVAESDASFFEKAISSYLPDVRFQTVSDSLSAKQSGQILEFKQKGHFAYPLQPQELLHEHDPVAYLTGAMTKLSSGEIMSIQIVASPVRIRAARTLSNRLLNNEELVNQLNDQKLLRFGGLFDGLNTILFGILEAVGDIFHSSSHSPNTRHKDDQRRHDVAIKVKPARTLTLFEYELAQSIHDKLKQPLFKANIRVLIKAKDKPAQRQKVADIKATLDLFSVSKYQSLKAKTISFKRRFFFTSRLPSPFGADIFSAAELSSLYHFPNTLTAKTENVVKSLSRTLPAPISLKNGSEHSIIIGRNTHHGTATEIGLASVERERHIFVIGGTGNGKTTFLQYPIVQDIQKGEGLAVIDPHGDMSETILRHIPENRINDVIYFNPDDLAYPIGLNLLELPPGLTGDELLREKELITESVVAMFRKVFSDDDTGGHRIEYVLRNTIQTALTLENPTLFTIYHLLNDPDFRKKALSNLEDNNLKNFWKNELGKAGGFQQVKMVAGITTKVGRFLFSASSKRILEQPKSTIKFDEILNGKILICNLSKGRIGEDNSELLGIAVLAMIQMAALRRARVEQSNRKPFYVYVDEFQNFATPSFIQMLSEARKYKLFLTMAEQSTSQQDDQQMVNVILANVGTVVCFRSGNPADEQLMLPLFSPYIEKGEIANLPSYNFYIRVSAINAQEPFSGETILLESKGSREMAEKAIAASRKNHAIEYKPPEKPKEVATPKTEPKQAKSKSGIPKGDKLKRSNKNKL